MINTRDNSQSVNVEAYLRDIKELLEKHYGEYAVYEGGRRVSIEKDSDSANRCIIENLLKGKGSLFLAKKIEPLDEEQIRILRNTNEGCEIKSCEKLS